MAADAQATPGQAARNPAQAAYEALRESQVARIGGGRAFGGWGVLTSAEREDFYAAAQAAIGASGLRRERDAARQDAAALRELIGAGQPTLARQLLEAREELATLRAALACWPLCPDGCGCRLGLEDADARECGCDGPCTQECRENGYPDAKSYRDLAVAHVMDDLAEANSLIGDLREDAAQLHPRLDRYRAALEDIRDGDAPYGDYARTVARYALEDSARAALDPAPGGGQAAEGSHG